MKVVCESCQAKYQVPDERVAGKKLKIRCKRCGATVLIRGDLVSDAYERPAAGPVELAVPVESMAPTASDYDTYEWHVSLDGDTRGPFDTDGVRNWLNATPSGWDAHVWREGFPDWIEARACAELDPPPAAPAVTSLQDDELPTQTFQAQSHDGMAFMADLASPRGAASMRSTQIGHPSALRARTPTGIETAPAPRVTTPQPYEAERHEDSVLFSQPNLQTMTSPSSTYVAGPNPGFANGEGSGLIDIRALASLARQGTTQITPSVPGGSSAKGAGADPSLSFGLDDDARIALSGQQGAFARIDSLAPVSNAPQTSNVALPLAILGGCALVAAAVFAAILFTRPPRSAEVAAVTTPNGQTQDSIGATAQPPAEDQGPEPSNAELNAQEREAAKAMPSEPGSQTEPAAPAEDELAASKTKRQPMHVPHQVVDEKNGATTPEEKTKPKREKEEKPEPQASTGETMMADRAKPVKQRTASAAGPESKPEPAAAPETTTNAASDIDSLIGSKPAKPAPKGPRSIDDLLAGADKGAANAPAPKPAAPTAAAVPAAAAASSDVPSDLPDSPSRDETLAAMRGVEAAVRACNTGPEAMTGTAEVALTVSGSTGRVTNANVTGITGNIGSCIARAVRNARFPHFGKPTFSIKYPYRF